MKKSIIMNFEFDEQEIRDIKHGLIIAMKVCDEHGDISLADRIEVINAKISQEEK